MRQKKRFNHLLLEFSFIGASTLVCFLALYFFNPFLAFLLPDSQMLQKGDLIFYNAYDFKTGVELYVHKISDGTFFNLDLSPGMGSSSPKYLQFCGKKICFIAKHPRRKGDAIWMVDENSKAEIISEKFPVKLFHPISFKFFNDSFYIVDKTPRNGIEIVQISNGFKTHKILDVNPGSNNSYPHALTGFSQYLLFAGDSGSGWGLFAVSPENEIIPLSHHAEPSCTMLTIDGLKLCFADFAQKSGMELESVTLQTEPQKTIVNSSKMYSPTIYSDSLYISSSNPVDKESLILHESLIIEDRINWLTKFVVSIPLKSSNFKDGDIIFISDFKYRASIAPNPEDQHVVNRKMKAKIGETLNKNRISVEKARKSNFQYKYFLERDDKTPLSSKLVWTSAESR